MDVDERSTAARSLIALRSSLLLFLHFLAASWGLHLAVPQGYSPVEVLFNFTASFGIVITCAVDSKIRHKPILRIVQFIMLFTWPVTAPIYLLWSRGWPGMKWIILLGASLAFSYVLPFIIVASWFR